MRWALTIFFFKNQAVLLRGQATAGDADGTRGKRWVCGYVKMALRTAHKSSHLGQKEWSIGNQQILIYWRASLDVSQ